MNTATSLGGHVARALPVARVPLTQPFVWLRKGLDDLRNNPGASLAYGLLVSVLGAVILAFGRHPYFLAASVSGFLLVGPLFTTGLCELSRLRANGQKASFDASLLALDRNRAALLRFSSSLLIISAVWFVVSIVMLRAVLGGADLALGGMMWYSVLDQVSVGQILGYVGVGGVLACVVFARSVVAVGVIVDRNVDADTAITTSLRATMADLPAMLVWAALIVLLVGLGFATFLVGMVVVFPLLGHAAWHAYKDLVK